MSATQGTTKIAVFASGRGTNFDAIRGAITAKKLDAEIVALVSDNPDAPAIAKAKGAGIRTVVKKPEGAKFRRQHEEALLSELRPLGARFVVLAGYMRLLTPDFIREFRSEGGYSRIVNVHPSLLPAFPGVGGYAQAFEHGAKVSGATVHLVDDGLDSGPICAQEAFDIRDCKSSEEVEKRGLLLENRLYPETLRWVLPEKFKLIERGNGRTIVSPN
jgi:phosphoribosylglycinamide formyltransferase-1